MLFDVSIIGVLSWLFKGLMTERDRRAFSEAIEKNDVSMTLKQDKYLQNFTNSHIIMSYGERR